jgi:hypothetical protein
MVIIVRRMRGTMATTLYVFSWLHDGDNGGGWSEPWGLYDGPTCAEQGFRQHLSWRQPMGRHNGASVVWWLNGVAVVGVLLWLWWRLLVWSLSLWLFASYVAVLLFCIFSCSINIGLVVSC